MTTYDALAPFYDGTEQIRFAALFDQYLGELLARHPLTGQRALDLACGTGTLALALARRGWDVVGLDASAAMLAQARAKTHDLAAGGAATFVQGDMRDMHNAAWASPTAAGGAHAEASCLVPMAFDLVTCAYDSLNYLLTPDDLAACFAGVARVLRPGGLFVADMNTRHFLEHDWPACDVLERPGFVQIARSVFEPRDDCSTMTLTCFVKRGRSYRRFDETHIARAYAPEVVAGLLAQVGLAVEAAYDCFTFDAPYPRSQRVAWVARRALVISK